ncbi:hypothetical protein ABPG74_002996 [Tetrahymena malaccensis]
MDQMLSQNSVSQNHPDSNEIIDEEIEERKRITEQAKQVFDEFALELKDKANEAVDLESFKDQFKFKTKLKQITFDEIKLTWERVQNKLLSSKSPRKNWSEDEVNIMIWLVIKYADFYSKDIEEIEDDCFENLAKMIPFKDGVTFKHKWLQMKQINLSQIPWTKEEDDLLTQIYLDFKKQDKQNKWSDISKVLENKTKIFRRGKQCRERWNNYLDPDMNRGNWSDEEDYKLLSIALEIGSTQWSSLAKRLSKRTENAVKNRFKSLMKKERKERIKNGQDVKSAESLTEHIDKEILTQILEKLKQKIAMKNLQQQQENNQINATNPALFQLYFNPQQNYSQLSAAAAAAAFLTQPQQQQLNFQMLNAHHSSNTPYSSPDHSPQRLMAQKVQQQQIGVKTKEEEFPNQLSFTSGLNSFSQAQQAYQQFQQQQTTPQTNQGPINEQQMQQQSQALQQQLQNLNLNAAMSPMNHNLLKNQLIQQQILQQQAQVAAAAQQQQQTQTGNPPLPQLTSLPGGPNTPNLASLMQSLQNQAMQNHTNLVQSPQFIKQVVPNSNQLNQQFLNQVNSNRSINGATVPASFSDAINIYSTGNTPQNGNQLNNALAQAQQNGMLGAQNTPFIQLANPTTLFTNQISGLSPTARIQLHQLNQNTGGEYTPQQKNLIPGLSALNPSFSCGNTPQSNRNKRSDKPTLFSDFEKFQKIRISENEELEQQDQKNSDKSNQKKAQKIFMNPKIEEEEEEEQQIICEKNEKATEALQKIISKQEVDQDNHENLADSPIISQNNLLRANEDQDSDSNTEAGRLKRQMLNLQVSQNSSFNKFRKDEYGNSIIKPQKLPISPNSAFQLEEDSKSSPQKTVTNGSSKPQNPTININLTHSPQLQNNVNTINMSSLNNLGSLNDITITPHIPISQNQFSNHQLSFQQLDFLTNQQNQNKQFQAIYSPSHQKQNQVPPLNFSIYSQMNSVSPSNSINIQLQKQLQQQQQQQQNQQHNNILQNGINSLNLQLNQGDLKNQPLMNLYSNNNSNGGSSNSFLCQSEKKESENQNELLVIQNILPSLSLQQIELLSQQLQQQQIAKKSQQEQQQQLFQQQMQQNSSIQKLLNQQHLNNGASEGIRIDLTQVNLNQF